MVIFMNVREVGDTLSFPTRDSIPADILTPKYVTTSEYERVCMVFFIALFDTLHERLSASQATPDAKADVMQWVQQMCNVSYDRKSVARPAFFKELGEKYKKVILL